MIIYLDGSRVIHTVGWKINGEGSLRQAFADFKYRADGKDGNVLFPLLFPLIYPVMIVCSFKRNASSA